MKTKINIEIEKGRKHVELVGKPEEILLELSQLLHSNEELSYILETACKFSKVMARDFSVFMNKNNHETNEKPRTTDYSAEVFAIIEEFQDHYNKTFR